MSIRVSNLLSAARALRSRQSLWTAIGVAGISLFAMNVHAQATQSVKVNYTNLDLSQPADAEKLYGRLELAARSVCRKFEALQLQQVVQQRACYAQALSDAVAKVDHANVTALYRADESIRLVQRTTSPRRS